MKTLIVALTALSIVASAQYDSDWYDNSWYQENGPDENGRKNKKKKHKKSAPKEKPEPEETKTAEKLKAQLTKLDETTDEQEEKEEKEEKEETERSPAVRIIPLKEEDKELMQKRAIENEEPAPEIPIDYQFLVYANKFNKDYRTMHEYNSRKNQFAKNHHIMEELREHLEHQFVDHNAYSDWYDEELQNIRGLRAHSEDISHMRDHYARFEADYIDERINWIERGAVTEVLTDGHCGACWASSSVAAIEAAHFIAKEKLVALSNQQLIDCDLHNFGCDGGFMANAFEYAVVHPLMSKHDYPYVGHSEGACHENRDISEASVTSYINVIPNNIEQLKIAVSQGPVTAAIASSDSAFMFYSGGIIQEGTCKDLLDYAVTIVGYDKTTDGQEYWLVKNSMGTSWGDFGFAKIAITDGAGVCGINEQASIPFV